MVAEERTIELTLISAVDLKKVKKFGREQKNYVVAYIYPSHKETTVADPYGGINPNWNAKVKLKCYESHVRALPTPASSSSPAISYGITMDIYCHSHSLGGHGGDKLVGTVTVPLHEIAAVVDKHGTFSKSFVILRPSGAPQGTLNISVKFGAKRELGEFEDPTGARFGSESSEKERTSKELEGNFPPPNGAQDQHTFNAGEVVMGYPVSSAFGHFDGDQGLFPSKMDTSVAFEDVNTGYSAPFPLYENSLCLTFPPPQKSQLSERKLGLMAVLLLTDGDEKYCGRCGKRIWRPDVKGEKKSFLVSYCKCSVNRSILDDLKAELPQRESGFGISGEYLKESRSVTKSLSSETVWTAQRIVKSKNDADVTRAVNRNTSRELVVSKDSVVKTAEKEQDLYLVTREIRRVEEESSVVAVKKDHRISVLSKPFATHKRIVLPPQTRVPRTLTKQRQSNFSTFRRQAKRQPCYGKPPSGLKLAGNISIRMKGKYAAGDSACDEQLSSIPLLSASDNHENSDDSHSRSGNQTAKHRHNMMLAKGGQLGARLLTSSAYRRPQAVVSKVVGQSEAQKPASTSHRPPAALAHMIIEGKDECGFKEKRTAVTKNSSIYYETESKGSGCSSASPHSRLTSDTADITRSALYCHEELESTAEDECGGADTSGIEDIKQGLRKCWRSVRKGKTPS